MGAQAGECEPVQAAVGKHPMAPSWQKNTKHLISLGKALGELSMGQILPGACARMGKERREQGIEGIGRRKDISISPRIWTVAGAGVEVAAWLEFLRVEVVREGDRSEHERR